MLDTTLYHFETFMTVAELGGFTAAAKKLGISKSAVSQTIKALESSIKLPLFIRSTRKVELSDEGLLLYNQCVRLKKELNTAQDLIINFNSTPSGTLKISCNPFYAETYLIPIIDKYTKNFPKVNLEIISEERMPDMQSEQIDIVFGVNWPAPDYVVAKKIGVTRYVLCASKIYLDKFGVPKNIKELESHKYIHHIGRSPNNLLVDLIKPASININSQIKINSTSLMKQAAICGLGIVQLHDYIIKKEIENNQLIEILPEYFNKEIPIYIYYQKHRFVQPKIRQFINLISST